jgi:predicted RNA-binding protein (virulence factor B family)
MKSIQLGQYNRLKVVKEVDFGIYLDGGVEGEILLPKRYVPRECRKGDELDVFIYLDQDERLVATTEHPLAKVGDFACLEVAWVNEHGAFLNWGLMKDLFCPFGEQRVRMTRGSRHVVHVHIDEQTYRIVASAKLERWLSKEPPKYAPNDSVSLLVWQRTDIGYKVIVDNTWQGQIYDNQIFRTVRIGDKLTGYVKMVRYDGKIDVTLQPSGPKQTADFADELLNYLQSHGGLCPVGDKSDPDDIYQMFKVSKKVFKRAVGDLYKRHLIQPGDTAISLVPNEGKAE